MHDDANQDLQHDPTSPQRDPVPPLAREILELYRGPLAEVRFPDLDREILETATSELVDAQRAMEAAERALEAARVAVAERTATLEAKAQRGLAYAKVFTEDQPELRARVAELATMPRRAEPARDETPTAPRKRGRPRKIREEHASSLFEAERAAADGLEGAEEASADAA